jgi:hypothetical protein
MANKLCTVATGTCGYSQYGTCFVLFRRCLEFWGGFEIFFKFMHPCRAFFFLVGRVTRASSAKLPLPCGPHKVEKCVHTVTFLYCSNGCSLHVMNEYFYTVLFSVQRKQNTHGCKSGEREGHNRSLANAFPQLSAVCAVPLPSIECP